MQWTDWSELGLPAYLYICIKWNFNFTQQIINKCIVLATLCIYLMFDIHSCICTHHVHVALNRGWKTVLQKICFFTGFYKRQNLTPSFRLF